MLMTCVHSRSEGMSRKYTQGRNTMNIISHWYPFMKRCISLGSDISWQRWGERKMTAERRKGSRTAETRGSGPNLVSHITWLDIIWSLEAGRANSVSQITFAKWKVPKITLSVNLSEKKKVKNSHIVLKHGMLICFYKLDHYLQLTNRSPTC